MITIVLFKCFSSVFSNEKGDNIGQRRTCFTEPTPIFAHPFKPILQTFAVSDIHCSLQPSCRLCYHTLSKHVKR